MSQYPENGSPPRRPYNEAALPPPGDDGAVYCSCGQPRTWPDDQHRGGALVCPVCDSPDPAP